MNKITDLLKASGDKLSKLAGQILQPEVCQKCFLSKDGVCDKKEGLKVDRCNLIPLTWPEAMKWRDWAVKEYGALAIETAMVSVMYPDIDMSKEDAMSERVLTISSLSFFAKKAQPEHYIKAACLCKLENDNGN